jgi:hypothetical protein
MTETHQGSCLCGKVRYKMTGPLRPVVACHCTQCRKQSGHFYAATNVANDRLKITGEEHIRWYSASASARRGFCGHCGSALFWKPEDQDYTSVLAGSIDGPSGLKIGKHIFVADKGDYYQINDGLPQIP